MDSRVDHVTGRERAATIARWILFVPAAIVAAYLAAVFLTLVSPVSTETLFGKLNVAWQGGVSAGVFVLVGGLVAPRSSGMVAIIFASVISAMAAFSVLALWNAHRVTAAFVMAAIGIIIGSIATAVLFRRA